MRRCITFFFTISLMILVYSIPTIAKAESTTEWKIWPSETDVKIYQEWEIKFSDEVDYSDLYQGKFSVVRESDNKEMSIEAIVDSEDKHVVKIYLYEVYDFGETYYLYIKDVKSINGTILKEPIKMKFQTEKAEFNIHKTMEQDGLKFDVAIDQNAERLYTKIKVTNKSEDSIPYWGRDGCDRGLSASLFSKNDSGQIKEGSMWSKLEICNAALWQYSLEPSETIEIFEVLYPPTQPLFEKNYLKVIFQKGRLEDNLDSRMTVEIPIELE